MPGVMGINDEFELGWKRFVDQCLNYGLGKPKELRCTYVKCKNKKYLVEDDLKLTPLQIRVFT